MRTKVNTPSKVLGMKNGLHKVKDEGSLPNFPLNTFVLGLIWKSGVLSLQSKSKKGGGHMSTQIPRIYSYPTVSYPYLPPPGPFSGATPRPGFVPVGFPLRSGDRMLLWSRLGDRPVRGRWR